MKFLGLDLQGHSLSGSNSKIPTSTAHLRRNTAALLLNYAIAKYDQCLIVISPKLRFVSRHIQWSIHTCHFQSKVSRLPAAILVFPIAVSRVRGRS